MDVAHIKDDPGAQWLSIAGASPCVLWKSEDQGMKFEGQLEGREVAGRPVRTDVVYDVQVSSEAGEFEAQIVNLSAMGFRLRTPAEFAVGTSVSLKVAKLPPVKAVICWVRGDECGGAFVDPVIL